MSKSDFVRWEDVDLDQLLGQYTDDCAVEAESSDSDRENKPPQPKKIKSDDSKLYVCPLCNKELKTVGGFRGHVAKQHNNPHLKACDHKKSRQAPTTTKLTANIPLDSIVAEAQKTALHSIASRNFQASRNNSGVAAIAEHMLKHTPEYPPLDTKVKQLFHKDVLTQCEREHLFARFHSVRCDVGLRDSFFCAMTLPGSKKEQILFYQCYLREYLSAVLNGYVTFVKSQKVTEHTDHYSLSSTDKEVLYHIAGFVLRKLGNQQGLCSELIKTFHTSDRSGVPTGWTERLDRGGLTYPTKDFSSLIQECDRVLSTNTVKLTAQCLRKDTIVERTMDDKAVKLCWDSMCTTAGIDTAASLQTLEAVITSFNTVKGFSIARTARQSISDNKRQKQSLRHSLLNSVKV